ICLVTRAHNTNTETNSRFILRFLTQTEVPFRPTSTFIFLIRLTFGHSSRQAPSSQPVFSRRPQRSDRLHQPELGRLKLTRSIMGPKPTTLWRLWSLLQQAPEDCLSTSPAVSAVYIRRGIPCP